MRAKIVSIAILTGILSLFISCDNFMNGSSLRQDIADAINYSNSEEYVIRFSSENGKISPSETKRYKNTDYISLRFTADSDYCFIRWTVINPNTNKPFSDEEIKKIVDFFGKIDDPEPEVKLLCAVNNMEFKAVTAKRPKVVSNSPVYDNGGVYRDRSVSIMFDKPIDETSIYWTYDEISEIVSESEYTYLDCLNEEGNKVYYGYVSKDDENNVTFKNITICDLKDQSINLLKYFDAPTFDAANRKTLRVATKVVQEGDEMVAYAPKAATEILVTINPEVHFTYESKPVGLPSEFSWVYLTNNKTDNEAPEFTADFFITSAEESQKVFDENRVTLVDDIEVTKADLQKYNMNTSKLWFKVGVLDGGSGPEKVEAIFKKLPAQYYPETSTDKIETVMLDATIAGSSGIVDQQLDISELEEGFYEVQLQAYDKNARTVQSDKYYFYYDTVAPAVQSEFEETFTDTRAVFDKNQLSWKSQFGVDMAKCVLTTEDITEDEKLNGEARDVTKSVEISVSGFGSSITNQTVSSLKNQHKYKNTLQFFDYAGNGTKIYEFPVDNTAPDIAGIQIKDKRPAADKALLSWAPVNITDVAKCVVITEDVTEEEKLNGDTPTATITTDIECTKGVTITDKPVAGLVNQHKYKHTAVFYDYAGNASSPVVVALDDTAPAKPESLTERRSSAEASSASWTDPSATDFAFTEIICKKEDGTVIESDKVRTGSKNFTDLENQIRYVYDAIAYDYSGNKSDAVTFTDTNAPVIAGLIETRTEAASATANWTNTDLTGSYTVVTCKKADGTLVETANVKGISQSFSGLENQTRYVYEAVAYDYSGNMSNTITFTDEVAPVISGLKESRTVAASATASWTNSDVDGSYTVLTCKNANGTLISTDNVKGTSRTFSGLVDQVRYVYTAVAYDYSGNVSSTLTFTDTTPPAKPSDVYSGGRDKIVEFWLNTPGDSDYAYTKLYIGNSSTASATFTSSKNTHDKQTVSGTNGASNDYKIYAYDYSGNKSEVITINEKVGVNIGMIVYKSDRDELFCSKNYYNKNPFGVICKNDDLSKVWIWDLFEYTGYRWGVNGDPNSDVPWDRTKVSVKEVDANDNLTNSESSGSWTSKYTNTKTGLEWLNKINSSYYNKDNNKWTTSIWKFIKDKDTYNGTVQWFIPSVWEYKYILNGYNAMKPAYTALQNNGYSAATLATTGQPYWSATPRYKDPYAYVAMFYERTKSGCDWIIAENAGSDLKRLYCTSDEREAEWYFKDLTYDDANGVRYYIRTHAMGQVNLK